MPERTLMAPPGRNMAQNVTSSTIRVLCVDDHSLVRKGISSILSNEADIKLVAEAPNGRIAVELFRRHQPDVTLMDLRMPEMDGIEATRHDSLRVSRGARSSR